MFVRRLVKIVTASLLSYFLILASLMLLTPTSTEFSLEIQVKGIPGERVQVYYTSSESQSFSEEQSWHSESLSEGSSNKLKIKIGQRADKIRVDLGNSPGKWTIDQIRIVSFTDSYPIELQADDFIEPHQISRLELEKDEGWVFDTSGEDPYFTLLVDQQILTQVSHDNEAKDYIQNALAAIVPAGLLVIALKRRRSILEGIRVHWDKKSLIYNLAKNDFKTKYAGSYLGVVWAFVQPVATILIYWFVFQVGFKAGPVQDAPFILWFIAGMVPWFYFSDALMNGTNSMIEYNYLVKKVVFQIEILPMVKHLSSLFVHLFFMLMTIVIFILYGILPAAESTQIFYYSICIFVLSYTLSYLCCTLIVFFKDMGQILSLILQFGMWLTPILWSFKMVPESYRWLLKLNPMFYVVEGYRDALIGHAWFWERYYQSIYFWSICGLLFFAASFVFKRLRPHFSDVI